MTEETREETEQTTQRVFCVKVRRAKIAMIGFIAFFVFWAILSVGVIYPAMAQAESGSAEYFWQSWPPSLANFVFTGLPCFVAFLVSAVYMAMAYGGLIQQSVTRGIDQQDN